MATGTTVRNPYFTMGTSSEQNIVEDLIIESMKIYGQELYYIPRTLVSKDDVLGEDRLSTFTNMYPIEMYFENVDSFDGQGAFIQKFGLMMEQSATLSVARRRWDQLVGVHGTTILPNRPCEGDLLYFPLTKGLFEIKFVKHQDPFYQLGRLYVYKLQVELFQYNSERLDTGVPEIDVFESVKTFSVDAATSAYGMVKSINVVSQGSGYTTASVQITSNTGAGATATPVIVDGKITAINVTNPGNGYKDAQIVITGANVDPASATAVLETNIDAVESYGDNNEFKKEASGVVFDTNNPFGD